MNKELDKFIADTKEEAIKSAANHNWRFGQAVFNYVEYKYGIARIIQFKDKVDCFYDDSSIDRFLMLTYKYLNS